MGDGMPVQWSVSRYIEVFREEKVYMTCGDVCGVCGMDPMNKAHGDIGNGKKER